jgi:hypothetical protein
VSAAYSALVKSFLTLPQIQDALTVHPVAFAISLESIVERSSPGWGSVAARCDRVGAGGEN